MGLSHLQVFLLGIALGVIISQLVGRFASTETASLAVEDDTPVAEKQEIVAANTKPKLLAPSSIKPKLLNKSDSVESDQQQLNQDESAKNIPVDSSNPADVALTAALKRKAKGEPEPKNKQPQTIEEMLDSSDSDKELTSVAALDSVGQSEDSGVTNVSDSAEDAVEVPQESDVKTYNGQIKPNQFIAQVFSAAGIDAVQTDKVIRALKGKYDFTKCRPGDSYKIEVSKDNKLINFEYQAGPDQIYSVKRQEDDSFVGSKLDVKLTTETVEVVGLIEHSLWAAFENAGESPELAAKLTDAFQYDIDFFHDTRKGDKFRFFVEKVTHKGQLVRYGQIFAAEYIGVEDGPSGSKRLYWFSGGKGGRSRGFYDETGKAAQRAFLRSPLRYTRISSNYGFRRHPILGRRHFHGGVDYAAPTGTPVQSVADGRVIFAATKGPNGKMVQIQHSDGYLSMYLHLSRILVKRGQRVSQSTVIGKVGSTGRSTGPHLDFRLKRRGKYINPRKNVAPRKKTVASRLKKQFKAEIASWVDRLKDPISDKAERVAPKDGGGGGDTGSKSALMAP